LIAGVGFVLLIGFIWHRTGTGRWYQFLFLTAHLQNIIPKAPTRVNPVPVPVSRSLQHTFNISFLKLLHVLTQFLVPYSTPSAYHSYSSYTCWPSSCSLQHTFSISFLKLLHVLAQFLFLTAHLQHIIPKAPTRVDPVPIPYNTPSASEATPISSITVNTVRSTHSGRTVATYHSGGTGSFTLHSTQHLTLLYTKNTSLSILYTLLPTQLTTPLSFTTFLVPLISDLTAVF
jgi:hypothetical protein